MSSSDAYDDRVQVEGRIMQRSLADFENSCLVHIGQEQRKANPDTALIALLCDAVRLGRELLDHMDERD